MNDENIIKELNSIDWRWLDQINDVDVAYEKIYNKINNIYVNNTKTVVKKKIKNDSMHKPWMNYEILEKIKLKNKLWSKVTKVKNCSRTQEYKKVRNEVTSLINKSKQDYYKNSFEKCKNDSKKIWGKIN